jgi:CubicO group peptidase (beta-lactamase class C family)
VTASDAPDPVGTAALTPLPTQPQGVPWPTLLWPCGEPDDDVDADALDRTVDRLFDPKQASRLGETHAVLAVHGGRIVAERYARGVAATSPRISWSTAKSMVSACVGMLVGDGRLDLDDQVAVPEWADRDDPRHAITLRHLLQFRPGLEWAEDYVDDTVSDVIEMLFGSGQPDMAAFAASKPLVADPGTTFCYSSGTSNIVSRIVRDLVGPGDDYASFLRTSLFDPIGMTSASPRFDDAGTWVASSYCYCTARDFARFAYLYLRDGVWEDQRILPEGWVDFSRAPTSVDADGDRHGAHFWIWDDLEASPAGSLRRDAATTDDTLPTEAPWGTFHCAGYEGQYFLIVPALDLVVVRLGKTVADLRPNLRRALTDLLRAFDPDLAHA